MFVPNADPAAREAEIERRVQERVSRMIDELRERRAEGDGVAFEAALRRVINDDDLIKSFWHRGYTELTAHAGNGASQWIGRRILTTLVVAIVTAGVVWLVKSGALK